MGQAQGKPRPLLSYPCGDQLPLPPQTGPTTSLHCPSSVLYSLVAMSTYVRTYPNLSVGRLFFSPSCSFVSGHCTVHCFNPPPPSSPSSPDYWAVLGFNLFCTIGGIAINGIGTKCTTSDDYGVEFGISLAYFIIFIPGSLMCWWFPGYYAYKYSTIAPLYTYVLIGHCSLVHPCPYRALFPCTPMSL